MDVKILDLLMRKLQEREEEIKRSMAAGAAADYAAYQNLCGVIRGLGAAQMEINDLLRAIKEKDED